MKPIYDLIIRGGTVVLPWGLEQADIGVALGRIVTLAPGADAEAGEVFDATGLHVLPGLIDAHTHLRDDPAVENIASGTRAAILGGLTAVFDMPNGNPSITTKERLAVKKEYAATRSWCDLGLYVGAARDNIPSLAELELEDGVCAIKVFAGSSTGDLLIESDELLEQVMRSGRRRIAYHSEDEYRLRERKHLFHEGMPYVNHMEWRDVEAAFLGTRRLMALARKTGRPAHILHVSTAEELDYLADYRDIATVEVLLNHLTQWAPDAYEKLGAYAVMNPPIRDKRHWEAAWAAVRDGMVDVVGSDHAPHSKANKEKPWPSTAAGLTGIQTIVPLMLDHVSAGRLSLMRLADVMCAGPARVYGVVGKGRIARGYDADFTIVDMKKSRTIEQDWIASPCGWSPFVGTTVQGWPVATIIRGRTVMRDDEVLGEPEGQLVSFAG
ncbi:dihydroorotase [Acidisoma silvae]|uniref:Dihydroorotase n=1 Tax=Acidisoma silvae TaxID=2802396 RepID=A0A963YPJ0_9PROT|nr:dihydroorotase [Acidisoma silvae]MCB8874313.1 dihydroorotase [Acidisoma silvae]